MSGAYSHHGIGEVWGTMAHSGKEKTELGLLRKEEGRWEKEGGVRGGGVGRERREDSGSGKRTALHTKDVSARMFFSSRE